RVSGNPPPPRTPPSQGGCTSGGDGGRKRSHSTIEGFHLPPPGYKPVTASIMQETPVRRPGVIPASRESAELLKDPSWRQAQDQALAALLQPAEPGRVKKLFIRTFGCQMNEYDSEKMADVLHAAKGVELTQTPDDADIIIFNTCSVREKAQEKVFSDLGRVQHLKRLNPELVIGVGGCVASQEGEAIVRRAPYVDVVFGPQTLHRLPELIDRRRATGQSQVDISF